MLLAAWAWWGEGSSVSRTAAVHGSVRATRAEVNVTPPPARAHRLRGEFLASQKEKHIQRLLANIVAALPQEDQLRRSDYLVNQVETLAEEDVPLVLQRLDAELRGSEFGVLLVRRWAETEPAAAAAWTQELGAERDELLKNVASVWSNADLNAAVAWAKGLTEGEGQQAALRVVSEETIRQQPATALELAASLTSGPEREQVTIRALNEWATQEPVTALRWVASITDTQWQQQLKASLIPTIASIDGGSGAQLTTAWLSAGPEQERIAVAVVQRWAQQSPEQAAAWVERFPEGRMRLAALDNLKRLGSLQVLAMPAP
jgi:hypothetical protein